VPSAATCSVIANHKTLPHLCSSYWAHFKHFNGKFVFFSILGEIFFFRKSVVIHLFANSQTIWRRGTGPQGMKGGERKK
jgi:hypothetical protein